jgi:hypothetical protein
MNDFTQVEVKNMSYMKGDTETEHMVGVILRVTNGDKITEMADAAQSSDKTLAVFKSITRALKIEEAIQLVDNYYCDGVTDGNGGRRKATVEIQVDGTSYSAVGKDKSELKAYANAICNAINAFKR